MPTQNFELHELKSGGPISPELLDFLYQHTNSYEELFNKRAQKFKAEGLAKTITKDEDYKPLILSEYTFIKRPIIIDGDRIFLGNSISTVQAIEQHFT